MEEFKRVSDYVLDDRLDDKNLKQIGELAGHELLILGITKLDGQHGPYMRIIFREYGDATLYFVHNGSIAIMDRLERVEKRDGFPVIGEFIDAGKYWTVK